VRYVAWRTCAWVIVRPEHHEVLLPEGATEQFHLKQAGHKVGQTYLMIFGFP
jgi:hypothetical protein